MLAARAGIDRSTVKDFESGRHIPNRTSMTAIIGAFEMAGVEFTNGDQPGVRMRRSSSGSRKTAPPS